MPIFNNLTVNEISSGGPEAYIPLEINNGVLSRPTSDFTYKVPDSVVEIAGGTMSIMNGLAGAFGNDGSSACGVQHLAGFNLNNVKIVRQYGMANCCRGCSRLVSVVVDNLEEVYTHGLDQAFAYTSVTSVTFTKLSKIDGSRALGRAFFGSSPNIPIKLYFPAITTTSFTDVDPFYRMVYQKTGVELHFPSNVQSVIEGLSGYSATAPFGASSGTVLFDLPATS